MHAFRFIGLSSVFLIAQASLACPVPQGNYTGTIQFPPHHELKMVTVFDGGNAGSYVQTYQGAEYAGTLSDLVFDSAQCALTGVWKDAWGNGTVYFKFSDDSSSFDGSYSGPHNGRWSGSR